MSRRQGEFSVSTKKQAYERSLASVLVYDEVHLKPHCEECGKLILGVPEFDHRTPLGLGGDSSLSNCVVLCGSCHRRKTHTVDRPIMTAADNQMKAEKGIKPASRPMDGSRNSPFKRKVNGRTERRTDGHGYEGNTQNADSHSKYAF